MQALKEEQNVAAWKVYTQFGGWRLDDEEIGIPFIEKARELDVRLICAHKGLSQFGLDPSISSADDIGVVAPRYPDVSFVVYHSGFEVNVEEGPYDPASSAGLPSLFGLPADGPRGGLLAAAERCNGNGLCRKAVGGVMCPSYRATLDEQHSTRGRARLLQEMVAGSLAEEGWRSTEVRDALAGSGLEPELAEVTMRPSTNVSLDPEDAQRMVRMLEQLEDLDDVQQVYSNADISEEILAGLA